MFNYYVATLLARLSLSLTIIMILCSTAYAIFFLFLIHIDDKKIQFVRRKIRPLWKYLIFGWIVVILTPSYLEIMRMYNYSQSKINTLTGMQTKFSEISINE